MNLFRNYSIFFLLGFWAVIACNNEKPKTEKVNSKTKTELNNKKTTPIQITQLEKTMINQGLVNIQTLDSTIMVELKYSTNDNFVKTDVYGEHIRAYMQKKPAEMLVVANKFLKEMYPNYRLLVYDGARPRTVQYKFWELLDTIPPRKRADFVADPKIGSIHNYGSAVDLTIYDIKTNKPLDMGTKYDYFGDLAYPRLESKMLKEGKLTEQHIQNRLILRIAMEKAGYMPIESEWWHFNAISRKQAKATYKIIE